MPPKLVALKGAAARSCGDDLRAAGLRAHVRPLAASSRQRSSAAPRSASNASLRQIQELEKENAILGGQLAAEKASHEETSGVLALKVQEIFAEDMLWRKRYRTLKAKHNRWIKGWQHESTISEDLLGVLLEAAAMDDEAKKQEQAEREEATRAAQAVFASRQALQDAMQRQEVADQALQDAIEREAAAAARELAVVAREEAAVAREEAALRQAEEAKQMEGTAHEAAKAAASRAATAEARVQELSKRPPPPRKTPVATTGATKGTSAYRQWRRRQVIRIEEFFINLFGSAWQLEFGADNSTQATQASVGAGKGSTRPEDVIEVFDLFFKQYQKLFDQVGVPKRRGMNLAASAEAETIATIQEHMDNVVVALYTSTDLTDRGYQALINYTSNEWIGERLVRLKLPWGTSMAKWMSKNQLKAKLKEASEKLGIEVKPGSAWLDPEAVLIKRIEELAEKGLLHLIHGMTIRVQLLGDASTVWKSMKVNGTTMVLKVLYDDKNTDGKKIIGDGVNTVQNQRAIGFYLGDDTLAQIREHAPDLPQKLAKLADEGITVNVAQVNIRLLLGGDLKFINSMLGLQTNSATFPCPFCITHHDLLHLTLEELKKKKEEYERQLPALKAKHLALMASGRRIAKKDLPVAPVTYLGPRTNDMQLQLGHVEASECCPGHGCWKTIDPETDQAPEAKDALARLQQLHFSTKYGLGLVSTSIALQDVIIDVLHVVLRIVPAIYRATVSAHIDKTQCADISQWIFDVHRVIVSASTAVQSATGQEGSVGNECWPGRVCDKLMTIYEDVLDMVHEVGGQTHQECMKVWDAFFLFNEELVKGCRDQDPDDVERHAARLQSLAEAFVDHFRCVASGPKVTPYMHCMMADIPRLVREHGGLVKYSSQGVERLHQWIHFITQFRSNRHHDDVGGTVLRKISTKAAGQTTQPPQRQGVKRHADNAFTKTMGNVSKRARAEQEQRKDGIKSRIEQGQEQS